MEAFELHALAGSSAEDSEHLPYGVVRLSERGLVEHLNRAEAERLGVQRWRTLGRDYFRDVAGPSARGLARTIGALAPGEHTSHTATLGGFRRNREGTLLRVEAWRLASGKVVLCLRPETGAVQRAPERAVA